MEISLIKKEGVVLSSGFAVVGLSGDIWALFTALGSDISQREMARKEAEDYMRKKGLDGFKDAALRVLPYEVSK